MNDLASLNGQPKTVKLGDKEYKLFPLALEDFGALQSWINAQFPDPLMVAADAIASGRFNVTQQQFLLKNAQEQALRPKHLIGTPEATELLMSLDGTKQILALSIRKGDPEFTDEQANEFFKALTPEEILKVASATNVDMVVSDPKVSSELEPTLTSSRGNSMSRRQRRAQKSRTGGGSGGK